MLPRAEISRIKMSSCTAFNFNDRKQLQWSQTERVYLYAHEEINKTIVEVRALREQEHSFGVERPSKYLTSDDAVLSLRWKKQIEFKLRWQNVLEDLRALNLVSWSIESMKQVESTIIDALDAQRCAVVRESGQYCALEQMLTVIQEAIHCLRHKMLFERLSCNATISCKQRRKSQRYSI